MTTFKTILATCLSLFFVLGFFNVKASAEENSMKNINDVPIRQWETLAEKRIYFGHQSVGNNIIDGIRAVIDEHPEIKLNISETRDLSSVEGGIFAHSKIGKNEAPDSKTDDFVKIMDSGVGNKVHVAFYKYCYIDVNGSTDIKRLFSYYKDQADSLQLKYPDTIFVHLTIPLTTIQTGPKALIKKMLGKPIGGIDANIKRNAFNQLVVSTYKGKAPVFDLAKAEATQQDGTLTTFVKDGKEYLSLYEGYSSDGGHLNKQGQKIIAEQLLIFLSKIN